MHSSAERDLAKKYALLRAKKQKEAQQDQKQRQPEPKRQSEPERTNVDAVRQKAIAALRAKRAGEAGGAPSMSNHAASGDNKKDSTVIKLVVPKGDAVASVARSAQAKPKQTSHFPDKGNPKQSPASVNAQERRRPSLKRPPMLRPGSKSQDGEPGAKRGAAADGVGAQHTIELPPTPQLYVGDLPEHFNEDMLWDFFSRFSGVEVVETEVLGGYCYGFVTFADYSQAQAVLDFHAHQPVSVEDRELCILWARSPGSAVPAVVTVGEEHSRVRDARAAAAQVAAQIEDHQQLEATVAVPPPPLRDVVTYDDL